MDSAPGGLAFVQDLLNTLSAGKPRKADLLDDPGIAQEWLDTALSEWSRVAGRPAPSVKLRDIDVEELHTFRGGLHRLVEVGSAPPGAGPDLPALPALAATVRLDERGAVHTEAAGTGWRKVASLALIECFKAQQADVWRRLKICRNQRCATAFYDRSRNNSGVWHDVRVCGNAANLRAYRARKRTQSD